MAERRLTVVQLLPALDGGGVEQGTLEIAEALVAAGHRSLVVSAGGRMVQALEAGGSEHIQMPVGRKHVATLALYGRLKKLFAQTGAHIVHPRSRLPAWVAYRAWRTMPQASRPHFVTTVHGFYSVGRYSAVMTRGERVIAVSNAIRDYIFDNYPAVDRQRVVTIHRGIDRTLYPFGFEPSPQWQAQWDAERPADPGVPLILLPGRLTRLKGHEQLLRLMRELVSRNIPTHALIAGGEDPRRQSYAHDLYNGSQGLPVSFLGHRTDLRELMSVSSLVLSLSSKPESFGRTVLEALSLGRPVIGLSHGGVGEILGELYPQGAVHPGSFEDLLDRVLEFLRKAPAVAEHKRFALREMQQQTLSLYEELASATVRSGSAK